MKNEIVAFTNEQFGQIRVVERDGEPWFVAADVKPSFKNTMDFIDRGLHMVAETFELACKLFENDVEALKAEWECSIAV